MVFYEQQDVSEGNRSGRRGRALKACVRLFLERGIDAVRMTDIAEETGIGVASLYRYYGTKTGITVAAMTDLWDELNRMFSGVFDSAVFRLQTGYKQVCDLMRMFLVLYTGHKDFLRLLGEFDRYLQREHVPLDELADYERSVVNFYPVFERSYRAGLEDGTIRQIPDLLLFYNSHAHAFMELGKKLLQGDLLSSDDFAHGERELEMMIETASYYLKNEDRNGAALKGSD